MALQNIVLSISVCLSDIPKDKITKANNGKSYVQISIAPRKETDQYGNDLTVSIGQSKEEREAKKTKVYVGNGKSFEFGSKDQPQTQQKPQQSAYEKVKSAGVKKEVQEEPDWLSENDDDVPF